MSVGRPGLRDWIPLDFALRVLGNHPAPRNSETGEPMWEKGIRLHGTQQAIIGDPYRFKQVRGGVRAGKSFIGAIAIYLDFVWMVLFRKREHMVWWVIGPDYLQAEPEMRHLSRLFSEAGIHHTMTTPKKDSWVITFAAHPGVQIMTKTASNEETIAGEAPRGIVMGEAAQDTEAAWLAAFERVTQSRGWVLMEGTFEGSADWYYQKAEEWSEPDALGKSYPLPTWANVAEFPGGRNDPAILLAEAVLSPRRFHERYGGEPMAASHLVFPEAKPEYHIKRRYPSFGSSFEPEDPVYLAIDPGAAHAYAVHAIQPSGNLLWVIDSIYLWGADAQRMIEEAAHREWTRNVVGAVMDIAGEQVSSTGKPNSVQWSETWPKVVPGSRLPIVSNKVPLKIGYDLQTRALLNGWPEDEAQRVFNETGRSLRITNPTGPRVVFDPDAAAPFFGGMVGGRQYRGEYRIHHYPRRPDGTIPRDVPVPEDDDAIKALTYFLYWYFNAAGNIRFFWRGSAAPSVPWSLEFSA